MKKSRIEANERKRRLHAGFNGEFRLDSRECTFQRSRLSIFGPKAENNSDAQDQNPPRLTLWRSARNTWWSQRALSPVYHVFLLRTSRSKLWVVKPRLTIASRLLVICLSSNGCAAYDHALSDRGNHGAKPRQHGDLYAR